MVTPSQPKTDDQLLVQLETGLAIDENALDEALMRQADLFYRVAKTLALRVSQRDAAKQHLAEAEAEVDASLRLAAQAAEKKTTEREIESRVTVAPAVKGANEQLHKLNLAVGQFTALKEAFIQRSYVLKSLGDLYSAGYFSDASTSSAVGSMKDAQAQAARRFMQDSRSR